MYDELNDDLVKIIDSEILEKFVSSHDGVWTEGEENLLFAADIFRSLSALEKSLLRSKLHWLKNEWFEN